ncbi:CHAP domain-containing protein [Nocardioides sp. zg-579]|uniref:CHAP domain-containing protein n=1 Tax=Nocardioides marmotae TaxID=2663857 RepID=A0A6I3JFL6_9ACTN|nr:CHAP domain-containing protein [Nocardioides marmotae]MCR6033418.1 CHAP domain-containing protein [Gordonia jinghuaiqii]MTB97076.1 CHAP domain-containing protein [Nocardioides marmotae]QKE00733.1 CHAP domain-containing protein [Nocardioides marmotae]
MPQQSQQSLAPRPTRPRRAYAALVLLLGILGAGLVAVPVAPAQAASTYLCTGYKGCREAGYSNAGYQAASGKMYWRMYAGHNCTNYVAYRMISSGMPDERPWTGSGNAENWGRAMASITDMTPMVGAVAWWKQNVGGAGSAGHVAYVEQVVSPTEIIVSEDSWGGDFAWRRITKANGSWPSGFIHFNDRVVVNDAPPAVVGTPVVGRPVSAEPGAWQPTATLSYQWLAAGQPVAGATTPTFTPTPALQGKRLAVRVTANRKGYAAASATSPVAPAVAPGTFAQSAEPVVTGAAEVDQTLTVSRPTYTPAPEVLRVQWRADGKAIPGATGWKLVLGQEQIGATVSARVIVNSPGYQRLVLDTPATEPVIAGAIEVTRDFGVRGVARVGRTLTAVPGEFTPADAAVTLTWLRDGAPVGTGPSYTLLPEDAGRRISLRADLAAQHYRSARSTVRAEGRVATTSSLVLRTNGRAGRAVVVVEVTAPGVAAPTGPVKVKVGGRVVNATVDGGRARVVVPKLKAGKHAVTVVYRGTDVVRSSRATATVVVR